MSDQEHLKILNQGVARWNRWREENPDITPDLSEAKLSWTDNPNLLPPPQYIQDTNELTFRKVSSGRVVLAGANLSFTDLSRADLFGADLSKSNLKEARLHRADLTGANLSDSDLTSADLKQAILIISKFREADLTLTQFGVTVFGHTDLTNAKGLEQCIHKNRSYLDFNTLRKTIGLPKIFVLGCGLTDWEIEAAKLTDPKIQQTEISAVVHRIDKLLSEKRIQTQNLFISYSHLDSEFVDFLGDYLNSQGITYWRDSHDAPVGPLERIIVQAIRDNPIVLLVFSEHSANSDWVEFEIEQARKLEKDLGRHVLCPISLDEGWKTCNWSGVILNQIKKYNILDFSNWREKGPGVRKSLQLLVRGLELFYREDETK